MRIYDGTQYRDMTPEEEAQYENLPPTPEESLTDEEIVNILLGGAE